MPESLRKAPFECPHCGFVQHEPPHLISTYCRSCGSHYKVAATAARRSDRKPAPRSPGLPSRDIHCHQCGHDHQVSPHARSTICPGCNASIDLENLIFSSHVSRPVDTRGRLIVEESACLNSGRVICGEALIEGKLNGSLLCEGALHLACKAKLAHGVTAGSVIIEKNANVELLQPVKTAELIVHGRASGRFECTGRVTISKRGILEGRLVARSVVVERGGSLLAESSIKSGTPTEANHPISTGPKDSAGGFASGPPLPAY